MQCNSKTYYQMFQLSAYVPNLCPQPKLSLKSFDQRPSAGCLTNRHSDVASTHEHLAQNFIRLALIALTRYYNLCILKSGMLGSHRLVAIIEVRHIATKLHGSLFVQGALDCCTFKS